MKPTLMRIIRPRCVKAGVNINLSEILENFRFFYNPTTLLNNSHMCSSGKQLMFFLTYPVSLCTDGYIAKGLFRILDIHVVQA